MFLVIAHCRASYDPRLSEPVHPARTIQRLVHAKTMDEAVAEMNVGVDCYRLEVIFIDGETGKPDQHLDEG